MEGRKIIDNPELDDIVARISRLKEQMESLKERRKELVEQARLIMRPFSRGETRYTRTHLIYRPWKVSKRKKYTMVIRKRTDKEAGRS